MFNALAKFYKIEKNNMKSVSRSLIIWETAIETWAQDINEGLGRKVGARRAEQFLTLEIIS